MHFISVSLGLLPFISLLTTALPINDVGKWQNGGPLASVTVTGTRPNNTSLDARQIILPTTTIEGTRIPSTRTLDLSEFSLSDPTPPITPVSLVKRVAPTTITLPEITVTGTRITKGLNAPTKTITLPEITITGTRLTTRIDARDGAPTQLDKRLAPTTITLPEITVTGTRITKGLNAPTKTITLPPITIIAPTTKAS